MNQLHKGFSIVSAIFLLVVLAFLGVAMVTYSTAQHQSSAMDVAGARAYQAAYSGLEWGIYQVMQGGGACAASTAIPAMPAWSLGSFSVTVTCVAAASPEHGKSGGTTTVYNLTSTAAQGTPGTPSYVERRLEMTVAL